MNQDICPTCKQPWPERRGRICSECQMPIGKHHRYHFVGAQVRHRDCADPELSGTTQAPQPRLIEEKP